MYYCIEEHNITEYNPTHWEQLIAVVGADVNLANVSDIFEEDDLGIELLFSEDYHRNDYHSSPS